MPKPMTIEVKNLHKDFGEIYAVKNVSFTIGRGEIFSLLGPNGAGKSTTISMLATLLEPTQGEAWVLGHSILHAPMEVKAVLGVVPQELAIYEDLSARENLTFWGKMYGLRGSVLKERVKAILALTELEERAKSRVGQFSGGMKRRLNLGIAMLHEPDILIMDEPTVGIDPQSRRKILDSVKVLRDQSTTILYTTHYMEEAQELSDHIAIMDHGEIIAQGTHAELVKIVGEQDRILLTVTGETGDIQAAWEGLEDIHQVIQHNSTFTLFTPDSNKVLPDVFFLANQAGIRITSVDIQEPNLEAVFLHLTGRALRD